MNLAALPVRWSRQQTNRQVLRTLVAKQLFAIRGVQRPGVLSQRNALPFGPAQSANRGRFLSDKTMRTETRLRPVCALCRRRVNWLGVFPRCCKPLCFTRRRTGVRLKLLWYSNSSNSSAAKIENIIDLSRTRLVAIIVPHQILWSWYTGRWWVGCYIWYNEDTIPERDGQMDGQLLGLSLFLLLL